MDVFSAIKIVLCRGNEKCTMIMQKEFGDRLLKVILIAQYKKKCMLFSFFSELSDRTELSESDWCQAVPQWLAVWEAWHWCISGCKNFWGQPVQVCTDPCYCCKVRKRIKSYSVPHGWPCGHHSRTPHFQHQPHWAIYCHCSKCIFESNSTNALGNFPSLQCFYESNSTKP